MIERSKKILYIALCAYCVLFVFTPRAFGATEISNDIRLKATSGGNSAGSGGSIVEGESSASIKIQTEINGEIVEDFEREFNGGDIEFEHSFIHEDEENVVKSDARVEVKDENEADANVHDEESVSALNEFVATILARVFANIRNLFDFFHG